MNINAARMSVNAIQATISPAKKKVEEASEVSLASLAAIQI
jgi:hypothetical protein